MICKECGQEIVDNAVFCGFCGAKVNVVEEKDDSLNIEKNDSICPSCGNSIKKGSMFCGECGYKFTDKGENDLFDENDKVGSETGFNSYDEYNDTEQKKSYNTMDYYSDNLGLPPELRNNTTKSKIDSKNIIFIAAFAVIMIVCIVVSIMLISKIHKHNADVVSNGTITVEDKATKQNESGDFDSENEDEDDNNLTEHDNLKDSNSYNKEDYILPTDTEYISFDDLDNLSKEEVALARNEIYARHGYQFQSEVYAEYFSKKEWYHPNPNFSDTEFSEIELANKDTIVAFEEEKGWR